MSFAALLGVLFSAWAISCLLYLSRIYRASRSSWRNVFSPPRERSTESRQMIRQLVQKIVIATILFGMGVIIAYFVQSSS